MNSPEDFDSLRKLLACKRHEQPPPGYFHYFSDKVIARIEAAELAEHSSWWKWLVNRFDARPVLACGYGFVISGLLLMGFRISQIFETELAAGPAPAGPWLAATPDPLSNLPNDFVQSHFASPAGLLSFSTSLNPVFAGPQPGYSFTSSGFRVQPASFRFGGE